MVAQGVTGVLDEDLAHACRAALALDRHAVREHALTRSWDAVASDLLAALVPLDGTALGEAGADVSCVPEGAYALEAARRGNGR